MNDIKNIRSFLLVINKSRFSDEIVSFDESFFCKKIECYGGSRVELYYSLRDKVELSSENGESCTFLLGDSLDVNNLKNIENIAHGVFINIDYIKQNISVFSSIVGLPPVFLYERGSCVILTSDIYLLKKIANFEFSFDVYGVFDLCTIGHASKLRTLFKDVRMFPPGHSFIFDFESRCNEIFRSWNPAPSNYAYSLPDFIDEQSNIFSQSIKFMRCENTFLSLTAGLDTRSVFAGIVKEKKNIETAVTITGKKLSLDAKTAKALCGIYGIRHILVQLDDDFTNNLEKYVILASRLSGGMHSLSQAHEIYFYEKGGVGFSGRVSGNLGNQIGRGGTEGVSVRQGDAHILSADFRSMAKDYDFESHWLSHLPVSDHRSRLLSLLQDEIPNSLAGNYCIGNFYALQISPYAHKDLIELTFNRPTRSHVVKGNLLSVRMKDLAHRFMGVDKQESFQRKYINSVGGDVAEYPINWGWRASGGVSGAGLYDGCLAMLDVLQHKRRNRYLSIFSDRMHATGMHVYCFQDYWIRRHLKSFVYDVVFTDFDSGLLDKVKVELLLNDYFNGKLWVNDNTLFFLLDISLAKKLFVNN